VNLEIVGRLWNSRAPIPLSLISFLRSVKIISLGTKFMTNFCDTNHRVPAALDQTTCIGIAPVLLSAHSVSVFHFPALDTEESETPTFTQVQELRVRSSDILMYTQAAASNNPNPSPVNASPNCDCIIKSDLKSEYRRIWAKMKTSALALHL